MKTTTIRTGSGKITIERGTEGPAHDPYGFSEYTYESHGMVVSIHMGVGTWVNLAYDDVVVLNMDGRMPDDGALQFFTNMAGISPEAIERAAARIELRCPKGGFHDDECMGSGYAGEGIYQCSKCGRVSEGNFDMSMIE